MFSKNEHLCGRNFEIANSARKELDCMWSIVRNFVDRSRNSSAYNSNLLPSWCIRRNINAENSANGAFEKTKRDSLKNEWILNEYGSSTKVSNQYEGSTWWVV